MNNIVIEDACVIKFCKILRYFRPILNLRVVCINICYGDVTSGQLDPYVIGRKTGWTSLREVQF
jgi:hypothetical protein